VPSLCPEIIALHRASSHKGRRDKEWKRQTVNASNSVALIEPIMRMIPSEQIDRELLQAALEGLERRRETLNAQIAGVRQMLGGSRAASDSGKSDANAAPARRRRRMSAAGRARIAEAQRKRWAGAKGSPSPAATKPGPPAPAKKRRISAEGRARIIAATKKRWAAYRASNKAGGKKVANNKAAGSRA
jgi:hypothetical protein